MSVLSFPRIYFNGYTMWDPTTANNNDYATIYDAANVDLHWEYLRKQTPPITRENFQETFRTWVVKPLKDVCPGPFSPSDPIPPKVDPSTPCPPDWPDTKYHMGSSWGYYGRGGCEFLDSKAPNNRSTRTRGGATADGQAAAADDAILNKPVVMEGDLFDDAASMARLVDINPSTPFCSQVFFSKFIIGDEQTYISAPRQTRMFSRAFFAPRTVSDQLIIAGTIGVIFQTTMSYDSLKIVNGGNSSLLSSLQNAMQASGAEGLMIRFATYNTLYYQNAKYNDKPQAKTACEISKMWQAGDVYGNPAYSRAVGAIGVWNEGELSSVPCGHQLVPVRKLYPVNASKTQESTAWTQGTCWAEIDSTNRRIALDLMNTIFEGLVIDPRTNDGTKTDYGTIRIGVITSSGFNQIGSMDYCMYDMDAYLAQSGLVDLPFDSGVTTQTVQSWLHDGRLALQAQQPGEPPSTTPTWQTFSEERPLTADTDDRGVYIDQNPRAPVEIKVQVRYKNGAPLPNTYLYVAQYFPFPLLTFSKQLNRFPHPGTPWSLNPDVCKRTPNPDNPHVKFVDSDVIPVTVSAGQDWGEAIVRILPNYPGFPNIVFYPYHVSNPPPPPTMPPPPVTQDVIQFNFESETQEVNQFLIGNTGYSAVRVMPFDTQPLDGKVSPLVDFVDCWNGTGPYTGKPQYNREAIWNWIYSNILYIYDMLFPVMDSEMPLHELDRVEGAIEQLVVMISKDRVENNTLYMPVTRDLSAAKRLILETWGNLVMSKYPPRPLPPLTPPT